MFCSLTNYNAELGCDFFVLPFLCFDNLMFDLVLWKWILRNLLSVLRRPLCQMKEQLEAFVMNTRKSFFHFQVCIT